MTHSSHQWIVGSHTAHSLPHLLKISDQQSLNIAKDCQRDCESEDCESLHRAKVNLSTCLMTIVKMPRVVVSHEAEVRLPS